ncbi:MAG: MBL fold metallo-hydrolase [Nibricoccus sp.]
MIYGASINRNADGWLRRIGRWFLMGALLVSITGCGQKTGDVVWTMVNVCSADAQADCHLIEFPDGTTVLIDPADAVGAGGAALSYLRSRNVRHLSLVVISHFHPDHYGRMIDIINAGIRVDRVALNVPGDRRLADREMPWGCDWDHVQGLLRLFEEKRIPYFTPKIGERILEISRDGVISALDVVCLYDGINTPVGETDINDTSILLRLSHGKTRAFLAGDLNLKLGTYLAQSDFDLKADILKVPHHGTEGVAPNEFFQRVGAKAVLVPSPQDLWLSLRSKRVRDFFADASVPAYVSGIHGNVVVRLKEDGFEIKPQRTGKRE